jgi:hypothetical protein
MATRTWLSNLNSVDRVILRATFGAPDGIDVYSLHERYLFSPAQIVISLEKMRAVAWLDVDGLHCKLTKFGREQVLRNRRAIFASVVSRHWAKSAFIMETASQQMATPYLPKIARVDLKFFKTK